MTIWSKLKVPELKAELKKRGLPQTGLKADLVARLTSVENESGFDSEATIKGDTADASPELHSQTGIAETPLTESQDDEAPIQSHPPSGEDVATSSALTLQSSGAAVPNHKPYGSSRPSPTHTSFSLTDSRSGLLSDLSGMSSGYLNEVVEDTQKRKRRSQSPPPSFTDNRSKRARPDPGTDLTSNVEPDAPKEEVVTSAADVQRGDEHSKEESAEVVTSAADVQLVDEHSKEESAEVSAHAVETVSPIPDGLPTNTVDAAMEDDMGEPLLANNPRDFSEGNKEAASSDMTRDDTSPAKTKDSRFKDLFSGPAERSAEDHITARSGVQHNLSDAMDVDPQERSVAPSIHSATSALYIRDFMRPLNRATLQDHIVNLATAPGTAPDPEVIVDFYLDPVRTHAFVSFKSVSAASRVRSELHDRVWPSETGRKPLWVDFIPSEKVQYWIAQEESTSGGARSVGKKWEIVYNTDDYNYVTASLEEKGRFVSPTSKPAATPAPSAGLSYTGIQGAPSGPRSQHITVRAPPSRSHLDMLFKSTTTMPVLYYQPVTRELAEKRLDHLEDATSKQYNSQDPPGEINRYTFEEGDALVDRGPEIFPGIRPPPGYRGRGGGGRGAPRGGGYAGHRERFRDHGDAHGGRGDGYGSRGDGYGGRGGGYGGRGNGYGGRGDGYRGRGGRYEVAGRDMRDSRDRRF